ncbi:MAG: hypothetical protein WB784_08020, partial [Rhodanobacteraceae bacterium]
MNALFLPDGGKGKEIGRVFPPPDGGEGKEIERVVPSPTVGKEENLKARPPPACGGRWRQPEGGASAKCARQKRSK